MKILKMYLNVKYCEVSNLHIANGTYNLCKLPKRGQNMQAKVAVIASVWQ
jgi:hypothetical protein